MLFSCWESFLCKLRRPGDTDYDDSVRRIMIPVLSICGLYGPLTFLLVPDLTGFALAGTLTVWCTALGGVLLMVSRVPGSYRIQIAVMAQAGAIGILLVDMATAAELRTRAWPFMVIVTDALLVFGTPPVAQAAAVLLAVACQTVVCVEQATRFGLFEAASYEEGVPLCNCSDPPCRFGGAIFQTWVSQLLVFLMDFSITRGFAVNLTKQMDLMATTVHVSERLVHLLAVYATEDARQVVAQEGAALPVELRQSYLQLLSNLDSYRAFLPDSLLLDAAVQRERQEHNVQEDTRLPSLRQGAESLLAQPPPPGLGEAAAEVAISFTDIQSSTELWEAHPQGMYEGLNAHNRVMRHSYAACGGYEVKTIGDSFMVAFALPADALRFGLEAQLGLLRQHWPEDLLTHPLCCAVPGGDGRPLWGGLRVRIGVHCGPARVERNPVTGRCDYFGSTVNTAARLEAVLRKGGLVAASDTVVRAVGPQGISALGDPETLEVGDKELKGVKEQVKVWAMAPQVLKDRFAVLDEPTAPAAPSPPTLPASPTVSDPGGRQCSSSGADTPASSLSEPVQRQPSSASLGSLLASPRLLRISSVGTPRHLTQPLRQRQGAATCAAARLPLCQKGSLAVPERHPVFVAAAALAADKTQGVVETVLSACVVVTWNASRPCAAHAASCYRFLGTPMRVQHHLGAASGGVLCGSVAAGRRSFAAVVGGCVELAAALAEEAESCGDVALAAGAVAEHCDVVGAAHWAQLWQVPGSPGVTVKEIEVGVDQSEWLLGGADDGGLQGAERWADEIAGLFLKACAAAPGSPEQAAVRARLEELAAADGDGGGSEARRLAARIDRGGVRTRPMPPLWDASESAAPAVSTAVPGAVAEPEREPRDPLSC